MPNTLGTTPGALIARRALATLLEDFPILRLVSSDYSDEAGVLNQPLSVKLPNAFTAATDYSADDGYEVSDASQVDCPLTITRLVHKTYAFNDAERNSFNASLIEGFARNAAHAVGMSLVNDLLALVTVANFENESVSAAADFVRAKFMDVNEQLTLRKAPTSGRVSVLSSPHFKKLLSDTTIVANAGSPSDAVRSGVIGNVDGVSVHRYAHLAAGGESLAGFISIPEALLVATRIPAPPESTMPGTIEVVKDDNTGLALLLRQWYDPKAGKEYRSYSLLTGVAKGIPAGLQRIVTAPNGS